MLVKMSKISIIIPTYNEKENIKKLIPDTEKVLKENKIRGEIIIIDDNSPDGTGELAESLNKKYRNIKVMHRKKKAGVGSARMLGFSIASNDIILSMEGDNTHNPKYIPKFIKEIEKGADLVIGSRYLKDSKIINWPIKRRIVSKTANFITRFFAGTRLTDATNGYRAFTKKMFKKLWIESYSYPFNMEFACETVSRGFKVKEIPIVFIDRKRGSSKLSVSKEFISFILTAFRFAYTYRPMKVFGSFGVLLITLGVVLTGYLINWKIRTGAVGDRLPLIFLAVVLILSGVQIFSFGLIVNVVTRLRKEFIK